MMTVGDLETELNLEPRMSSRFDARLRVTALAVALAVGGCGDPVSPPEATKITVSPSSAALQSLGETVRLTATVLDQNGNVMTDVAVTWSSRNNEVATVDAAGLVTAVAGGTVMVQAATGTVTGTAEVRVDQTPVEVRVSPGADTLTALDDTVRLSAEAFDANGHAVADAVFAWSSDDETVAAVDADGLVTAAGPGGARVTAETRGVAGSAEVVVDQVPAEVRVSPGADTLTALDDTVRLSAEAFDANGHAVADAVFAWSSDDETVAAVDADGLVTAAGPGGARVTAETRGVAGSAEVVVDQTPAEVRVSPGADTLTALDDTVRLSAEAFDANGHAVADAVFAWSSDDETVAAVDADGLVTAAGPGGARVTAETRGVAGSAEVVVDQTPVEVRVSPGADTLTALDDTVRLSAEAFDANGHAVADAVFAWSSDDETVAAVDADGLVTAAGPGGARVTAETRGVAGSAEVVVDQTPVEVRVSPGADTLTALDDTVRLSAEAFDANGHAVADAVFAWSSDDETVAAVDADGLVTAAGPGGARVTAETRGVAGSAEVVVDQTPVEVRVSPGADTLTALDDTVRLSAEAFDANGHAVADAVFAWSSDDETVAAVDADGLVTAVANGSAEVVATVGVDGVAGSAALTVAQRAAELHVSPLTDTLLAPDTLRLSAEAFDANGHSVAEIEFRWASGDESVATVDAGGLVTVLGAGSVVVTVAESTADLEETVSLVVWGTREELIRMYEALGGEEWTNADNWGTDAPLDEWYGVTTDGAGRIIQLRLNNNGLAGPIPAELGRLESLEALDLSWSWNWNSRSGRLTGSIPPELGNLSHLEELKLNFTGLSGSIPEELGKLSNLRLLWLGGNAFSGSPPPELGNLSNLESLDLSFSGSIPPELGNLSNLKFLWMIGSGSIPPELGNLSNLESLDLAGNDLSGSIPPELGNLSNLDYLSIEWSDLSGSIPSELGNLSSLEELYLPGNELSGSIPPELGNLSNLVSLGLGSNELSGSIPPELGNLSHLVSLGLGSNELSGSIPPELGNLSHLVSLGLGSNELSGSIPPELGDLSNLDTLEVHDNDGLSGPLPLALDGLPLYKFHYHTTKLCAPEDASFQTWLNGIYDHSGTEDCVRRLTGPGQSPKWSPDGEKIAFVSYRDGNLKIFVMDADGNNRTRLTKDSGGNASPAWSPDGEKIAFHSTRDGNHEIYVMEADGSNQTRLTNDSGDNDTPAWSPDGEKIAFHSIRDGNQEIYVMEADGSNQTRLTNDSAGDARPAWSPDGEKIAFHSNRDGNQEIYVMEADGSNQTRLTNHSGGNARPVWSPDGEKIVFHSNRDGNQEIYVMEADGSNQTRLTNDSGGDARPAWSPDGEKIAFHSNRDGNQEIYVMEADGSNQTRLTNDSDWDIIPAWSPDGTEIAFTRGQGNGDRFVYILQIK